MIIIKSFLELPFEFDFDDLLNEIKLIKDENWVKEEGYSIVKTKRSKYINFLLSYFRTKVDNVQFIKLDRYSVVRNHSNKNFCLKKGYVRLYIPIINNKQIDLILKSEKYKMQAGKCYFVDISNPYSIVNDTNENMICLMIDCYINDYLKNIFVTKAFKDFFSIYRKNKLKDEDINEISTSFIDISLSLPKSNLKKNSFTLNHFFSTFI